MALLPSLPSRLSIEETKQFAHLASTNKQEEIEEILPHILKHTNADKACSRALLKAAKNGYTAIVALLAPHARVAYLDGAALLMASQNGHTEAVKALGVDQYPSETVFKALVLASQNGHTKIVEHLLPFTNPKMHQSQPLQKASMMQHVDIFDFLYPVSDPKQALKSMAKDNFRTDQMALLKQRIEDAQTRERLEDAFSTQTATTAKTNVKKM